MKTHILTVFVAALMLAPGAYAHAQESLPSAGLTPASPFYFLERMSEGVIEMFTWSAEGKAKLQVKFASERVAEARALLEDERPNLAALEMALARVETHSERAAEALRRIMEDGRESKSLADEISRGFDELGDLLAEAIDEAEDKFEALAEADERALKAKLGEEGLESALEAALVRVAAEVDQEVGRPLEGFNVIEDEANEDLDGDTYSATYRAEADGVVDLTALRERILATARGWESGDVDQDSDSLDITFEKSYSPVIIEGVEFYPEASVTLSVTVGSPEAGMTSINYDVDITLESRGDHLADLLDERMDDIEERAEELEEAAEEALDAAASASKAVREVESERQELINEAAEEGMMFPAGAFSTFDRLLAEAKAALSAGNFEQAERLAERAEGALDDAEDAMEDMAEATEKEQEKRAREADREVDSRESQNSAARPASSATSDNNGGNTSETEE